MFINSYRYFVQKKNEEREIVSVGPIATVAEKSA
jgi:hypothetical protein